MRALLNWRSTNGWFPQISECWTDQYMGMAKTFVGFGEVIVDTTQKPIHIESNEAASVRGCWSLVWQGL